MSLASMAAYSAILPELPRREQAVLGVLLKPRDHQPGMTNREIARELGLDRDSISPRTARLRQKGLVAEIGTRGTETIYEAVQEPTLLKLPKSTRIEKDNAALHLATVAQTACRCGEKFHMGHEEECRIGKAITRYLTAAGMK